MEKPGFEQMLNVVFTNVSHRGWDRDVLIGKGDGG